MKIKFQADADFNQRIVRAVLRRQPAIDFQSADEGQIRDLNDPDLLTAAAGEGRIVKTAGKMELFLGVGRDLPRRPEDAKLVRFRVFESSR